MEKKDIYILGVGRNTGVYMDLVEACGYKIVGLIHYSEDRVGEDYMGVKIVMSHKDLFQNDSLNDCNFAISVGDNYIRTEIANKIRKRCGTLPQLIHPTVIVSKRATVADNVVVHANSVIQAGTSIGFDSVISYNVSLTHTSQIGRSCYLAAGSNVGAYVNVEDNVFIGQGATIISGKVERIGKNSIVGAGSLVTKSVPSNVIVAGSPARIIKELSVE